MADKCPECRSMIRLGATRCRCGWKAPQPGGDAGAGVGTARPSTIPCDLSPCLSAAKMRIRSRGTWLNVCHDCYVEVSWSDLREKTAKAAAG